MKKFLRILRKVVVITLKVLGILFIILSILPYLLPINKKVMAEGELPFENSAFMELDDHRWHYRIFEPNDSCKGNYLLIHGFSGSTFSWRNNARVLQDAGYRVLTIDLPAFGYSEKTHNKFDHSATAHAQSIWSLIDSLSISPVDWRIVGHSMGAGVACYTAAARPSQAQSLIMVDGAAPLTDSPPAGWSQSLLTFLCKYPPLLRWADVIGSNFYLNQETFEELLTSAYSQPADSLAANGYLQPFLLRHSSRAVVEGFLYSQEQPAVDTSQLTMPVLLIWGTKDEWVPLELGQSFKEAFPAARLEQIEGAGHCPMETHAEAVNRLLLE